MCGRYRNRLSYDQMKGLARKAGTVSNAQPNLDIRPTTTQWIVRGPADDSELTRLRWGLIPFWFSGKPLKDFKLTTFNAKAEGVATAASFKGPFVRRRCLVIADGWYEWTGAKGSKERWLFTPRDGEPLTFGGCWDKATLSDVGEVESFTIVTQPAGAPLNGYHDRAPVVIAAGDRDRWLTVGEDVTDLIGPDSADAFHVTGVSKDDEASWKVEA